MKRHASALLTITWLMLGMAPANVGRAWAAAEVATLKSVTVSAHPTGQELVLRLEGSYTYKTVQATPDALFIDLAGAEATGVPRRGMWSNPTLAGYRLLQYHDASGQPVVRVQIDTRRAEPFVARQDGTSLRLLFGETSQVSAAVTPVPATPEVAPLSPPVAHANPPAKSSGPLVVSSVSLDKRESGETFVDVATSRHATYHVMSLKNPSRLVVDIDGKVDKARKRAIPADTAVLREVRVGQFDPSVVRVVADLNGEPAFDVHATPAGLRIELLPRGVAKSALTVTKSTPPAPDIKSAAPPVVAEVTPPVVASRPINHEVPLPPAPLSKEVQVEKVDVQSALPPVETSPQIAAAPLPPPASETPESLRAAKAARTLTPGKEELAVGPQAPPPANPPAVQQPSVMPPAEEKPVYTGEPISLNLKDVDLKDFFRLIHEISGLNIIVDPNVSGSVTVVLDSVPWDQALDIVLKDNRLGKVLEGNVLRIAQVATLTAEQDSLTKLADARMNAAPLVTIFQPINYAKASEIAALLKTWAGGGALSRRGTVLVDARNNTLIVSDVQTQIPIIQSIIRKIDKKAKQVQIESRVVLASADFSRTLQAALEGATRTPQGSTAVGGVTGVGSSVTPTASAGTISYPPSFTIAQGTTSGFGNFSITNASSRYLINAVIAAQEERDQAKTISRPTIVTQNNVQGMVQQGVQVPIQTSINNTISVQYFAATLQLTVTPQITDDGNIFMIINVQNSSVGASITSAGPNINTQQATTQVLVPDGGTVIFGGITVTSRSKSATYVPWLGSIPLLGNLFKTSNVTDSDQELLFFVSPKILGT
jgi:type IV pilus assembly protein PilQ